MFGQILFISEIQTNSRLKNQDFPLGPDSWDFKSFGALWAPKFCLGPYFTYTDNISMFQGVPHRTDDPGGSICEEEDFRI